MSDYSNSIIGPGNESYISFGEGQSLLELRRFREPVGLIVRKIGTNIEAGPMINVAHDPMIAAQQTRVLRQDFGS